MKPLRRPLVPGIGVSPPSLSSPNPGFLRVRLYLVLSVAGLLVDLVAVLYRVLVHMERTSRMTLIGSLVFIVGAALVFGAIFYKTHKRALDERIAHLRRRFGSWE